MTAVLDTDGPAAPPRANGEIVFAAPWERRLFGVTLALHERGVFAWDDFRALLIDEIGKWSGGDFHYYPCWERALHRLLVDRGLLDPRELEARTHAIAHEHAHDHDH